MAMKPILGGMTPCFALWFILVYRSQDEQELVSKLDGTHLTTFATCPTLPLDDAILSIPTQILFRGRLEVILVLAQGFRGYMTAATIKRVLVVFKR